MTQCKHDTSGNQCWCNPDREDYRDAATVRRATLLEVAKMANSAGYCGSSLFEFAKQLEDMAETS